MHRGITTLTQHKQEQSRTWTTALSNSECGSVVYWSLLFCYQKAQSQGDSVNMLLSGRRDCEVVAVKHCHGQGRNINPLTSYVDVASTSPWPQREFHPQSPILLDCGLLEFFDMVSLNFNGASILQLWTGSINRGTGVTVTYSNSNSD